MNDKLNGISENKLKHILGVARTCQKLAKEFGLPPDAQHACFVMGILHDIGYEYCEKTNISNHSKISHSMICEFERYKYYITDAIKHHGDKYDNLTIFDEILNAADLTTNYNGEPISIEDRIENIKQLYGEDSMHYKHAKEQADTIRKLREQRNDSKL